MAFPPQPREQPPGLPSISLPVPDHFRSHHNNAQNDMTFGRSPAMSIPNIKEHHEVPPPLPPPRRLPMEGAPSYEPQEHKKTKRDNGYSASSSSGLSGLSGYGSFESSLRSDRPNYRRRDTGDSTTQDEGYSSYASTERSRDSFPGSDFGFGLSHNRIQIQSPADLHSDNMKRKLDPIRTSDKSPPRSSLLGEMLPWKHDSRFSPTFNMPIHSRHVLDSPNRLTETPIGYSAMSPRSAPFHHLPVDHRSPAEYSDLDRSPRQRKRNNSDDTSTQGSYEDEMEIDEDSTHGYMATGQKRRAASPARDVGTRGSPTPRLTLVPQPSSIASFSTAASRSNSYISTASMAPSSITTAHSFSRHSPPGGVSPPGMSPTSCNSPYNTPTSLNPSPRMSIVPRVPVHSRNVSATSPKREKQPMSKLKDFHMCDCCPKKPKKFETHAQLVRHEEEKQYNCLYCGNRFKNKNEAERHQNSLHVRRHSWSCSALSHYDRAFHDSTSRPGEADTCGYCGDEFPRTGRGPGGIPARQATDQDWEERIRHLQEVHKFRECNSSKKFFRADHFRQHLKHSHAGTSGKWTNMLENACMIEEDPTPR